MGNSAKLLIFHPTIAPYRVDFFNDLNQAFNTRVCLKYWNLRDQTFDYKKIYSRFTFKPYYLKELFYLWGRSFCTGYWKHLNQFEPDLVITEEFGIGTLLVLLHRFLKRKKYRIITLCDDSYDMVAAKHDFSRWHRMARRYLASRLNEIVVVEPKVQEWYQEHDARGFFFPIIQEDTYVRHQYQKVLPRSMDLRHRLKLGDKRVYLFVGRLVALKNVKTILRAFSRLEQRNNVLVVVGSGPEKYSLTRLADNLGLNVRFTGRLEGDALNVWYNIADVLVLASYQEAFGAVTNEALLAGCYVLVSDKAGSSCLVVEGENGFTFNPMDVDGLAEKMQTIRSFPIHKDEHGLKRNQMRISYKECMNRLVVHLQSLAYG